MIMMSAGLWHMLHIADAAAYTEVTQAFTNATNAFLAAQVGAFSLQQQQAGPMIWLETSTLRPCCITLQQVLLQQSCVRADGWRPVVQCLALCAGRGVDAA